MVDQIGTVAIKSPASPEVMCFSAFVIRIHGMIISATAYGITYFQYFRALLIVFR